MCANASDRKGKRPPALAAAAPTEVNMEYWLLGFLPPREFPLLNERPEVAGAKRSVWVDLRQWGPLVRVCLPCGGSRASCSSNVEDEVGDAGCAALAAAAAGSAEVTRAVPIRPTPEPVVEAGTAAAQVEAGGGVEVGAEVDGAVVEAVAGEMGMRAGAGADEAVGETSGPSGRSSTMAAKRPRCGPLFPPHPTLPCCGMLSF